MNYGLHLIIYLAIYIILSTSLNFLVGYGGLLTLAHAGYFAIGAYTYALLTTTLGWGFIPACAAAVFVSAGLSLALSLPSWRLRGDFFVMVSLAIQALIFSVIYNWFDAEEEPGTWTNLTNGSFGIDRVPHPHLFGVEIGGLIGMAALFTLIALGCVAFAVMLLDSPWGRVIQAMRDDELAARGLGKRVRSLKVQVVLASCSMAAIGGALYASYVGYVDPSLASLDMSILLLCMVLVGGSGNLIGPIVGAVVVLLLPEVLRFLRVPENMAAELRLMLFGLTLVVMMQIRPQGLAGRFRLE